MKIAIHHKSSSFSDRWIAYCKKENIDFKIVNAYQNDIVDQVLGCDAFMWHHGHSNPKDILFANQLLYSLRQLKIPVFPNFNTSWHFDDKVAQKYLLEVVKTPIIPSYIFYSKKEAIQWIEMTRFPKVFKLRGGAGSANVKLARTKTEARKLVSKAFGRGFRQYEPWSNLKERWRKYKDRQTDFYDVVKGLLRFYKEPEFSKTIGYERGYVYFQDFIPDNNCDIRVIVIGERAFALKRMVRKGDFRASGSGEMKFDKGEFDERCIKISFETSQKLEAQCLAYDFVFDKNKNPLIVEISYGFSVNAYDPCPGYWDVQLKWCEGSFNPQEWMIKDIIKTIQLS